MGEGRTSFFCPASTHGVKAYFSVTTTKSTEVLITLAPPQAPKLWVRDFTWERNSFKQIVPNLFENDFIYNSVKKFKPKKALKQ